MSRFLVTGANGFIGRHLVSTLGQRGFPVVQTVRTHAGTGESTGGIFAVGDVGPGTTWDSALNRVNVVVHLAARVHVLNDSAPDPLHEFRAANVAGTERLAWSAAAKGARRFVYLSSAGVNGPRSGVQAFTEQDSPRPYDAYTVSKWEAEEALRAIAGETGLEVVILRPPLVYGPDNPGNFLRLLGLISSGWPLPLRALNNRRSLIFVGNLVDAIIHCALDPAAAGQTYLVKDGEDVSTPELIRRLAALMELPPRLVYFPPFLLRWAAKMAGKTPDLDRLMGSFIVDDSKIRVTLGWRPPYSLASGLRETIAWYRRKQRNVVETQ
jgi:nucleoside-diphosphate-sugar epimerase